MPSITENPVTIADYKGDVHPDWCPGCGDFGVLSVLQRALAEMGIPANEVMIVSGIGCSSNLPGFINTYGLHTLHGRSLPIAQGFKLANHAMNVIACGGDGDGYGIGVGHFIHAMRRNIDMTYVVMNNSIYAKAKPDIRKANVVAKAVKAGDLDGPQTDAESVFGDAAAEQRFVEEMNHAALSAMRGEAAYDFELCSEVFAHLGLCFDPQTKEKVSKGIPRDQMPQFSSQVDPSRTDSPAFIALMRGKGYTSPDQVTPEDLKSEVNMEREFRKALEDAGYEIADEEVSVTSLKPIQGQLKGEKIAGMYGTLAAAQSDPQNYGKAAARLLEPIYVSDGYVIDGHHRWAAQVSMDIANGSGANATMKTRTITKGGKSVPVEEIIKFSNKFQKDIGLLSQTRGGETIPEKKPTQKEWTMGKFGSKRVQNIVESLNEAAKAKFKKPRIAGDEPDTFGYGARVQRGGSVGGKMGVKPVSLAQQVNMDARARLAVERGEKTAADLMKTVESKPEGTTFEIYGSRDGKETSVKVKKVRYMGDIVYMVGNTRVELRVSGVGLKVVNPKTNRTLLDRGADLIWESADFCDVGRITITEIRKLTKDELAKIRPGIKKPAPKK